MGYPIERALADDLARKRQIANERWLRELLVQSERHVRANDNLAELAIGFVIGVLVAALVLL
jgi:hypothetical protein